MTLQKNKVILVDGMYVKVKGVHYKSNLLPLALTLRGPIEHYTKKTVGRGL